MFNPKRIKKASEAAEGLCKWVIAMCQFEEVMKIVKPKQAALKEAEQKVDAVLRDVISKNPELVEMLGARALQGKAYLPGSEEDIDVESDDS